MSPGTDAVLALRKLLHFSLLIALLATGLLPVSSGPAAADTVKLSGSGICHDANSRWFAKTKNYKAFGTMPECLLNGRAYKGFSGDAAPSAVETLTAAPSVRAVSGVGVPYDRHLYDHWIDEDGDCQNARHELLQELSTAPVKLAKSRCTVTHGRWNDPYTGEIHTNSRDLDIDHMVPLAWAHAHGANKWGADLRRKFANDPVNLFAVLASANRQKGAKGPLDWLPPNQAFQCQYVTRFHRIVLTYRLQYTNRERREMDRLRSQLCS